MRTFICSLIALAIIPMAGCQRVPDLPVAGDPMYEECASCEEFLLDSHLHVIPSHDGLVSIWDEKAGWLAEDMYPEWETKFPSDTLVLVRNGRGRYAYIHAVFGVYWITDTFDMAWPFSDGVAAVMKDKRVYFIDFWSEQAVGGYSFPWNGHYVDQPIFKNGVCAVANEDRQCGVIDLDGHWVIEPQYSDIQFLDEGIICESPGVSILYSYDGAVINPCIVEHVSRLSLKERPLAACMYEINERVGLMDMDGHRLTEAVYTEIWPMTENLFGARLSDGKSAVVLNKKGEVVRTTAYIKGSPGFVETTDASSD